MLLNRYIILRGVFAKNASLETKISSPFGSGNALFLYWYFSQIPLPNMIYLFIHFIFPFPDFNDIIFNIVRRQNRKTTSYGGQPQQRQQCEPFIIGSSCASNKGKTVHEKTMQIQFIFYFPNDYCNLFTGIYYIIRTLCT